MHHISVQIIQMASQLRVPIQKVKDPITNEAVAARVVLYFRRSNQTPFDCLDSLIDYFFTLAQKRILVSLQLLDTHFKGRLNDLLGLIMKTSALLNLLSLAPIFFTSLAFDQRVALMLSTQKEWMLELVSRTRVSDNLGEVIKVELTQKGAVVAVLEVFRQKFSCELEGFVDGEDHSAGQPADHEFVLLLVEYGGEFVDEGGSFGQFLFLFLHQIIYQTKQWCSMYFNKLCGLLSSCVYFIIFSRAAHFNREVTSPFCHLLFYVLLNLAFLTTKIQLTPQLRLRMQSMVLLRRIITKLIMLQTYVSLEGRIRAVEAAAMLMWAVVTYHDIFRAPAFAFLKLLLFPLLQLGHALEELHHQGLLLLCLLYCVLKLFLHLEQLKLFKFFGV